MKHPVPTVAVFITVAVLAFLGHAWAVEQCVKVRITNCYGRTVAIAYGPVNLCAEVRVQPDENHRYLETVWDYAPPETLADPADVQESDPFMNTEQVEQQNGAVGSSVRSLDGEQERIRQDVKMHHLEGGTYEIVSTVYADESRKKVCGRATARVIVR